MNSTTKVDPKSQQYEYVHVSEPEFNENKKQVCLTCGMDYITQLDSLVSLSRSPCEVLSDNYESASVWVQVNDHNISAITLAAGH